MNKEDLINSIDTYNIKDLASEIEANHPLFAVDLLLFVNSELFDFSKEVFILDHAIGIIGEKLIRDLLKEYKKTDEKKYRQNLFKRYNKQKKDFSEQLKNQILVYLAK